MKLIIEKLSESTFRPVVMDGETVKLRGAETKNISADALAGIIAQISAFSDLDITEVENQLEN